jgi:hypothetical protein
LESSTQGGGAPPAIRVAIIDTALRPHEFLEGKAVTPAAPEAFVPGEKYSYRAGHGTFVTGLVLGQAPDAAVTVIGTLDKEGRASSWDVANAILDSAAGADGAQIINLSLACYTSDGIEPLVFSRAISELPKDTLVVAAAGNMGNRHPPAERKLPDLSKAPAWPAALPNVLAIGAATGPNNRQRAPFSPNVPWINVLAPGVDVVSILPEGGKPLVPPSEFAKWSGTSFSAAEFTGAVAERAAAQNLSPLDAYFTLRDEGANGFTFLNDEF